MKEELMSKQVSELTDDEMEELVKERKKKKIDAEKKRKERYVKSREAVVNSLKNDAFKLSECLAEFKKRSFEELDEFYNEMRDYGQIPSTNKGNFTIKSADGSIKIEFTNHIIREFDERAEAAAEHMENFLKAEFVKKGKRKQEAYKFIKALLTKKGPDGSFDIKLINRLEQMRDEHDHPEWIKSLDGFKEAYSEYGSSRYVRFYKRNESTHQFEQIPLNFARI